jgi:predicted RNA-binding protein with PIN domain
MRLLIDGYNLMYAVGLLGKRLGPDGFRKVRQRFLNDLADALGAVEAHQTTVVFDAAAPPDNVPCEQVHKGITVVFAVDDDDADTRIERLIAQHSAPKALTVVSSDNRIRLAATRRKARIESADDFWSKLEDRRSARAGPRQAPPPLSPEERARLHGLGPDQSREWLETFRHVADEPDAAEALGTGGFVPTEDEIARIEREVEGEP